MTIAVFSAAAEPLYRGRKVVSMIEINYMVLEDVRKDARIESIWKVFVSNLHKYLHADKQLQRLSDINCYGSAWQRHLLENPDEYRERLNKTIDAAFSSFTVLHKEYKKLTGARLFDGGIGVAKRECTEEEWDSFRPEKAEMLDEIVTYLILRTQEKRKVQ